MQIHKKYSHLNGEEYLLVHKRNLYDEIMAVIDEVNAEECKTKVSKERRRVGNMLYSPTALNKAFERKFIQLGWESRTRNFYISDQYETVKIIEPLEFEAQQKYLESINHPLLKSYNQTDFVKDGVALEVQFGKYFAVTYDLFVKHLSFYNSGIIDVGVEIVPGKYLQSQMSSGPPFFEKEVHNVLRHGRNSPAVPILMIGINP